MENQQFSSIPSQIQTISLSGIGDLLGKTWQIYKERIGVFLGIMIFPVLIFFIIGLITGSLFVLQPNKPLPSLWTWITIVPITALIIIIIYLWSTVSLLFAIKERELRIGIRESFAKGWPKIISYLWISILVGFAVIIGLLLFIVPGIIFAVWFSLAAYVFIAENLTGTKALSRSKQLVSGFWWKVFWRFLVIGIIALIISFILGLFEGILGIPEKIDIASIIVSFFFTPFATIYTFLIYEELKKIKGEIPA